MKHPFSTHRRTSAATRGTASGRLPFLVLVVVLGLAGFLWATMEQGSEPFSAPGTLVVFAHQDDDLLWMQPFLASAETLLLAASPPAPAHAEVISRHPRAYRKRWQNAFPATQSDQAWLTDYALKDRCQRDQEWTYARISAAIEPWIATPEIRRIVTHNPWGEYGHIHHRLVHRAVREAAVRHGKDVWMLNTVVLFHGKGAVYLDLGDWGLTSARTEFDARFFHAMRAIYQAVSFAGDPPDIDTWTWLDGPLQFPHGQRTFVKIVDKGTDQSSERKLIADQIAALTHLVPLKQACSQRQPEAR